MRSRSLQLALVPAGLLMGLLSACDTLPSSDETAQKTQAVAQAGSALEVAYGFFHQQYDGIVVPVVGGLPLAAGHNPGLTTGASPLGTNLPSVQEPTAGSFVGATAQVLIRNDGSVTGDIAGLPPGDTEEYELWFVKNVPGAGRSVLPEDGDLFVKAGRFDGVARTLTTNDDCASSPGIDPGSLAQFDLDMVVVTKKCEHPKDSRVLVGNRTLFEKRYFREKLCEDTQGQTCPPVYDSVTGPLFDSVATHDPLVRRGAKLFFEETFDGNGRTCGTCHRQEHNLTIDADFIAGLAPSDPLFVFKNDPALANLEVESTLEGDGLVLENVDGFSDPANFFALRAVNHTFAMNTTLSIVDGMITGQQHPVSPPHQLTGWGGDGAPGRGTLHEFALGAIVQHASKRLDRVPGVDFRIPTQEELDALEAFQLFSGRQDVPLTTEYQFLDPSAESGKTLATAGGAGKCGLCHNDVNPSFNPVFSNFATGVGKRDTSIPADNGFKSALLSEVDPRCQHLVDVGDLDALATFSPPPLIEAADSAPLFHNNSAATIEDAILHYTSDDFLTSCGAIVNNTHSGSSNPLSLTEQQVTDLASFLRQVNAAENMRQVNENVLFVRDNRSPGNDKLLEVAIADLQDAIDVLAEKNLAPQARQAFTTAKQTLQIGLANPDAARPAFMDNALIWLNVARNALFVTGKNGPF